MKPIKKFGLALGGGGSRAFLHLGVLSRLEEAGLVPDCISGSSMGAVLGALYAANPDARQSIPGILDYFRRSSLFGGHARQEKSDGLHKRTGHVGRLARKLATASIASVISFRKGLRKKHPVNHAIDELFGKDGRRMEDLPVPFGLNALNLTSGAVSEFTSGPLAPALKAGVAIGLIFAPYVWDGEQYADAAPIQPVPVGLCRKLGADIVLAVDICAPLIRPLDAHSGFDVVQRIMSMQSEMLGRQEIDMADMVLKIDASHVFWADFSHIDALVEQGRAAAGAVVEELADTLGKRSHERKSG